MANEVERIRHVYAEYESSADWSGRWSEENAGNLMIMRERSRNVVRLLANAGFMPLESYRILDVGCGHGNVLASFTEIGAVQNNLFGIDLVPDRIQIAKERYPAIHFRVGNAETMSYGNDFFDIVVLFTVFSSILDAAMCANIAREVDRVLRPGGGILWYDMRVDNPANRNIRGWGRGRVRELFRRYECHFRSVTLAPPIARRLGVATNMLYPALSAIPAVRTHNLGLLVKSA